MKFCRDCQHYDVIHFPPRSFLDLIGPFLRRLAREEGLPFLWPSPPSLVPDMRRLFQHDQYDDVIALWLRWVREHTARGDTPVK